jgi:hypothetical protein
VLVNLSCPACGGPLPLSARWLTTRCPYCTATVARAARQVEAARYRAALAALDHDEAEVVGAEGAGASSPARVELQARSGRGGRLDVLGLLARGARGPALLVRRARALSERLVLRLARPGEAGALDTAATALNALQRSEAKGAPTFSRWLPRVEARGACLGAEALLLSYPPGFVARLDLLRPVGGALDPRHLVWVGKRLLELLHFVHQSGWTHGALRAPHVLLHPRDHGAWLVGWSAARPISRGAVEVELRAWAGLIAGVAALRGAALPQGLRGVIDGVLGGGEPTGPVRPADLEDAWALRAAWDAAARADFGPARYLRLDLEAPPSPISWPVV